MLNRLGSWIVRRKWLVIVFGLVAMAGAGIVGAGSISQMSLSRFEVPGSESDRAGQVLAEKFGTGNTNLVLLVTAKSGTVDSPEVREAGLKLTEELAAQPSVGEAASYWSRDNTPTLRSEDGKQALIQAYMPGDPTAVRETLAELSPAFTREDDLIKVEVGGQDEIFRQVGEFARQDFVRAELIILPAVFLMLLLLYRRFRASLLTMGVGLFSMVGTLAGLAGAMLFAEISTFALNLTLVMGLGLGIDYSLFMIARFREELAAGRAPQEAAARTVATAGRTVIFSGVTVAASTSVLFVFPFPFLQSFAYTGILVVASGIIGAVVILPAFLSVLGPRMARRKRGSGPRDAAASGAGGRAGKATGAGAGMGKNAGAEGRTEKNTEAAATATALPTATETAVPTTTATAVPTATASEVPTATATAAVTAAPTDRGLWYRFAKTVMRRPVLFGGAALLLLLALGSPITGLRFGLPDDRSLPADASSRIVQEQKRAGFPAEETDAIQIVAGELPDPGSRLDDIGRYAAALSAVPGIAQVDSLAGSYANGERVLEPTESHDRFVADGGGTWLSVVPLAASLDADAPKLLGDVRAVDPPFDVLIGGYPADLTDFREALLSRIPLAAGLILAITFVILFLMTGSLLLPLKATVLNVLSLSIMFGALVWVFQDGNLSGLLNFTSTGTIEPSIPILMFCIAYGLSMDYEVFILSRIKEEYDRTGDMEEAVAGGIQKSGPLVTAAALILAFTFAAYATGDVVFLKMLGVGMTLAVLVDATLIRGVLVPAFMKLAGRANWWAPPALRRFHERFGISESGDSPSDRGPDGSGPKAYIH